MWPLDASGFGKLARVHGEPLLELDRGVRDPESRAELFGRDGEQCILAAATGTHEVHGERDVGGAHAPDVQVMHLHDAVEFAQYGAHRVEVDAGRYRVEREVE